MATEKERIQYSIELVDEISSKLKKIKTELNDNEKSFDKTGKSVSGFGGNLTNIGSTVLKTGLAIGGITTALVSAKKAFDFTNKAIFDFSGSSAKLKAIVQPTTQEFQNLEKAALKLGSTTAFTASQVMDAFTEQAKLGQKANEILASGNSVLNLAAMSQISLSEAATTTVQTLNQFGLQASETNRVVDVMAKAFVSSALDANKFAESMKYAGTIGAESGESIENVTAALGVLADRGIDASQAGTAVRRILLELADTNSKVSKTIRATGVEAETFGEKLQVLKSLNVNLTETTGLFDLLSSTAATVLIGAADDVQKLSGELQNADGSAKKMAETMLDSLPGAVVKMKSALEGLALTLNTTLAPAYKVLIDLVTKVSQKTKELITGEIDIQNAKTATIEKEIKQTQRIIDIRKEWNLTTRESMTKRDQEVKKANDYISKLNEELESRKKVLAITLKQNDYASLSAKNAAFSLRQLNDEMAKNLINADQTGKVPTSTQASKISRTPIIDKLLGSGQEATKEQKSLDTYTQDFRKMEAQTEIQHQDFIQSIKDQARERDAEESRKAHEMKIGWLEDLTERNKQHAEKRLQDEQRTREAYKETMIDSAIVVTNTLFTLGKMRTDREQKLQIQAIKNSTKSEEEKAKAIEAIEKASFEKNKRAAIFQAIINGALGITKTIATVGMPAAIPMLILQGVMVAAQIATIAAQKFAKGGIVQKEIGKSSYGDQHLIRANPGEMVLTQEQQKRLGSSINIGDTNIIINGNVNQNSLNQIERTLQDRNENLRMSLLQLQESGRLGGLTF